MMDNEVLKDRQAFGELLGACFPDESTYRFAEAMYRLFVENTVGPCADEDFKTMYHDLTPLQHAMLHGMYKELEKAKGALETRLRDMSGGERHERESKALVQRVAKHLLRLYKHTADKGIRQEIQQELRRHLSPCELVLAKLRAGCPLTESETRYVETQMRYNHA